MLRCDFLHWPSALVVAVILLAACGGSEKAADPGGAEKDSLPKVVSWGGQTYRTVKIGTQTWMAENLNYAGASGDVGVCFDNRADLCGKYGRLYTWDEAMSGSSSSRSNPSGVQGICPNGWHVPSDTEWTILTSFVGEAKAGYALKTKDGWASAGDGVDSFGFGVLPAGNRRYEGEFGDTAKYANFWTSSETPDSSAMTLLVAFSLDFLMRKDRYKSDGYSLRCVEN